MITATVVTGLIVLVVTGLVVLLIAARGLVTIDRQAYQQYRQTRRASRTSA